MIVAIVGGTGTVGRLVAAELAARGHDVRLLSRRAPQSPIASAEHHAVDLTTGEGLDGALAGAACVVDAANSAPTARQANAILVEGTRRVARAAAAAGLEHHVLVSIIGIDDVPTAYYRAKVEQERVVDEAPTPRTILRATQFHTLLDQTFAKASRAGVLPGAHFPLQPVDPATVAAELAAAVEAGPSDDRLEVAGPEVLDAAELSRRWRAATGRRGLVVPLPLVGAVGRAMRGGALTSSEAARAGSPTFEAWLRARQPRPT